LFFGDYLKSKRLKKKLSLRGLANMTNIDHTSLGRIEKNLQVPTLETIARIAKELDISGYELLAQIGMFDNVSADDKEKLDELMVLASSMNGEKLDIVVELSKVIAKRNI
jgi:transcriptional regulator with XRE-family HTH domain